MQIWAYPAILTEAGPGDWVASFPDLPEALTGGASRDEALALAEAVLDEAILARLAHGEAIPAPRPAGDGETLVRLDVLTAARAALAAGLVAARMSNAALARSLGKSEGAVRRLTDGRTGVKIDTVLEALNALGDAKPVLALV